MQCFRAASSRTPAVASLVGPLARQFAAPSPFRIGSWPFADPQGPCLQLLDTERQPTPCRGGTGSAKAESRIRG